MTTDIYDYIGLPRSDRTKHLDLSLPCSEIGGDSRAFRGILAFVLKTTIPKGMKIHLCHACHNDKCSNPSHLYWGTPAENFQDGVEAGAQKTFWERMLIKYGEERAHEVIRAGAIKGVEARQARMRGVNQSGL